MNVSNVHLEETNHQAVNVQQDNMKKIINVMYVTINVKLVSKLLINVSNVMETESMIHSVFVHQDFMMMAAKIVKHVPINVKHVHLVESVPNVKTLAQFPQLVIVQLVLD